MIFRDILDKSCYASIATVTNDSLEKVKFFIEYNKDVIKQFPLVIIALNKQDNVSEHIFDQYANEWRKAFKVVVLELPNKGHMRGTIDLEESILIIAKQYNIKYLWKSMEDVVIPKDILDRETTEADFYYLPGFSTESLEKYADYQEVIESYETEVWTPQTTFFIIDISKIDTLYGKDVEKKWMHYETLKQTRPYLKPWEVPFDIKFDCESMLGYTTKDFSKKCLLNLEVQKNLINFALHKGIGDPSHKNLFLDGFCHFHFWKENILEF